MEDPTSSLILNVVVVKSESLKLEQIRSVMGVALATESELATRSALATESELATRSALATESALVSESALASESALEWPCWAGC